MTRLLRRLSLLQTRRPGAVIVVVALLAALGVWRASKLTLVTDFSDLLPQDQPSVVELRNILGRTRGLTNVFVVLEGGDARALRRIADTLVPRLLAIGGPRVESARSGVQEARRFFMPRAGFFLSETDLAELETRVTEEERRVFRGAIGADLGGDDGEAPLDPKELERRLTSKISSFSRFPDGYFQGPSPHGTAQLIVLKSAVVTGDLAGGRVTLERVSDVVAKTLAELGDEARGVQVGYAGDLLVSMAEYELVRRDVLDVGGVGVGAVLIVLLLFFRSFRALVALGVTIAAGCAITFGLTEVALGHLNVATAFLFSIVAGNGVNTGIIWLARFLEERYRGRPLARAISEASCGTWGATLTAACAAAAAYAALGIGSFRGFRHFAIIGASGMLICWAVSYTLLPAVAVWLERHRAGAARFSFAGFDRPFVWLVARAPRAILSSALALAAAASIAGGIYLWRGPLEYDMRRLQSDGQTTGDLYRVSHLAADILGAADNAGMIVLTNDRRDTPVLADALRKLRDRAAPSLKPFEEVHTLDDLVPHDQEKRLARLAEVSRRLRRARDRGGISDELWGRIQPLLPSAALRPYTLAELPPSLVELFTEKDGTIGRILYIEPTAGQSDSDLAYLLRWADAFRSTELPNGRVVHGSGRAVIFADLLSASLIDMPRSVLLSLMLTGLTVVILFRRGQPVAIVLGSLVLALVWMVGALAAWNVRLSFINFIALPITFGIGVDYPVNVYGRYAQNPAGGILVAMRGAGGAVLLCSLTTSLGYLALLRAHNQAVRSLGAVAVLGEVSCVAAALLVLPAFVSWRARRLNA